MSHSFSSTRPVFMASTATFRPGRSVVVGELLNQIKFRQSGIWRTD
jgi:hypothetical protein